MAYLLDTGFLYAALNNAEEPHATVIDILEQLQDDVILPVPAITEVAYLLKRDLGVAVAADFIASLVATTLILETPRPDDYQRAAEVMRTYADARLDFVDGLIVAIAERLNITRLLTLDQRDFRLIRPRHRAAFELLP